MTKNIIIVLSAALIVSTSAVAYEDPENRIGDRYPLLEPAYRSNSAFVPRQVARPVSFINEEGENKIGDRYPLLEPGYRPILALTPRQIASFGLVAIEDPENKIGDKYPLLEPRAITEYRPTRRITIRAIATAPPVAMNGRISKRTVKQRERM